MNDDGSPITVLLIVYMAPLFVALSIPLIPYLLVAYNARQRFTLDRRKPKAEPDAALEQWYRAEVIAEVLKVTPRTVRGDWRLARACLYRALKQWSADDA